MLHTAKSTRVYPENVLHSTTEALPTGYHEECNTLDRTYLRNLPSISMRYSRFCNRTIWTLANSARVNSDPTLFGPSQFGH